METRTDSDSENKPPNCPKCDKEMVRREAKRGANKGGEFWGCPAYPKCRGTIFDKPAASTPGNENANLAGNRPQAPPNMTGPALNESDCQDPEPRKPNTYGRWKPEDRREILSRVYDRDGGRCGLCGMEMEIREAAVEHIVPKIFGIFNVYKGGKAVQGTRYKSLLHKEDNLQAAHAYCNKAKGNTPKIVKWRHPTMPPLGVAQADDGTMFVVPWNPKNNPSSRYEKTKNPLGFR